MIARPFPLLRRAVLGATLVCLALNPAVSHAQEPVPGGGIEAVSPRVLFVVSGGYWEGEIAPLQAEEAAAEPATAEDPANPGEGPAGTTPSDETKPGEASTTEAAGGPAPSARGFYRLVVLRSDDNSSRVHLQRFALSPEGPMLVDGRELAEISSLPAYVTDARSEDTSSVSNQPGFAVFITLKTDPSIVERETWTVFVDEFGEVEVNRATN